MNCFLQYIVESLKAHAEAFGVGGAALTLAAIKCMPRPGSSFSFLTVYTWLYNTMQAAAPIPHDIPSPTPPVTPANPSSK